MSVGVTKDLGMTAGAAVFRKPPKLTEESTLNVGRETLGSAFIVSSAAALLKMIYSDTQSPHPERQPG